MSVYFLLRHQGHHGTLFLQKKKKLLNEIKINDIKTLFKNYYLNKMRNQGI